MEQQCVIEIPNKRNFPLGEIFPPRLRQPLVSPSQRLFVLLPRAFVFPFSGVCYSGMITSSVSRLILEFFLFARAVEFLTFAVSRRVACERIEYLVWAGAGSLSSLNTYLHYKRNRGKKKLMKRSWMDKSSLDRFISLSLEICAYPGRRNSPLDGKKAFWAVQ